MPKQRPRPNLRCPTAQVTPIERGKSVWSILIALPSRCVNRSENCSGAMVAFNSAHPTNEGEDIQYPKPASIYARALADGCPLFLRNIWPIVAPAGILDLMKNEVTRILGAIEAGNPQAAAGLLPLVYEELRKLAAAYMANEASGHILSATALVHEAYLRLVGDQQFNNRGHFFAAASEAMRRVLVDHARNRKRLRRGGPSRRREELDLEGVARLDASPDDLLDLDAALSRLEREDPRAASLVKLRMFAGLTQDEAATALGVVRRTADRDWAFARAWLFRQLSENSCRTAEPDGA
jgi:RNA polymerase sigma factor (TIGR02999 family)